jgi:hypothetical protein
MKRRMNKTWTPVRTARDGITGTSPGSNLSRCREQRFWDYNYANHSTAFRGVQQIVHSLNGLEHDVTSRLGHFAVSLSGFFYMMKRRIAFPLVAIWKIVHSNVILIYPLSRKIMIGSRYVRECFKTGLWRLWGTDTNVFAFSKSFPLLHLYSDGLVLKFRGWWYQTGWWRIWCTDTIDVDLLEKTSLSHTNTLRMVLKSLM